MKKENEHTFNLRLKSKTILICLALLLGGGGSVGGGYAVFGLVTENELKGYLENTKKIEDERHAVIDMKFIEQSGDIKELKSTVSDIQETQISDIARKESRRLTEDIRSRKAREANYDRLLRLNTRRLKAGQGPCTSLECN